MRALTIALWLVGCSGDKGDDHTPDSHTDDPAADDTAADGDDTAGPTDADGDGFAAGDDCDDDDPDVYPGADERCDGADDDCDGEADDGLSAPDCMPDAPSCPLLPTAPAHPTPLVALSFESDDWTANEGSLTDAWAVASAQGTLGDGAVGQGLALAASGWGSATNDHLRVSTHPDLHPETFAISAWINPEEGTDRQILAGTLWDSEYAGFSFDMAWGQLSLRLGGDGGLAAWYAPVPLGAWSHVAASFDGEVVSLYVNGELRARSPLSTEFGSYTPGNTGSSFTVGAYQNPAYYAYTGELDELRYYGEPLTGAALRREAEAGRWRFEERAGDDGPAGRDLALAGDLDVVCGPVGSAWRRAADDAPATVDEDPGLALRAGLGLGLLVRPDSLEDAVLATREGAWSLELEDGSLVFAITGDTGEEAELHADLSARVGMWSAVRATFDGLHARLFVDGALADDAVTGFERLAAGEGGLVVGEGLDGAIDEVVLSPLALGIGAASEPLLVARWAPGEVVVGQDGVSGEGLAPLDLAGSSETATGEDELRSCLYLQAEARSACPWRVGDALEGAADVGGPLTLRAVVRPDPGAADAGFAFFGLEDGPSLELSSDGFALAWGDARAEGGPAPSDQWTVVTGVVSADGMTLYVDGTEAGAVVFDAPFDRLARFPAGSAARLATRATADGPDALRIDEAALLGEPLDADGVALRDAPWRTETHPALVSADGLQAVAGEAAWRATAEAGLAALSAAGTTPGDEDSAHYTRAEQTWAMASAAAAATEGAEEDAWLEATLARLEDLDTGYWQWGWFQGRTLSWYALAYDTIAPLLTAREAEDPWTWAPRHAAIRRSLLAIAHQAWAAGGLSEDGGYEYGYHYSGTSYTSANARLMVSGGLGHLALVLPAERDRTFLGGADLLAGITDDLFEVRPGEGEAQGAYLPRYIPPSGLFCEGTGYQNDVFYLLTPFLVDLAVNGGADALNDGRLGAMYDADVAGIMPSGHTMTYATGWLDTLNSVEFASMYAVDADRAAEWAWLDARQTDPAPALDPPAFTSSVLGVDAAVLRSGWGPSDLYLFLLGKTEGCYSSHGQADALSLSLMAHGAWLLIDPGDGRSYRGTASAWKEEWLQGAEGHNNVLVDGEGPAWVDGYDAPEDPAAVVASLLSDRADYAWMAGTVGGAAADGGADVDRRVWLVDDAFAVVADHVSSDATREVTAQFHLGGSFLSGYGLLDTDADGFVWSTLNPDGEDVTLHAVALTGGEALSVETGADGGTNFHYPYTWDHRYARLGLEGDDVHLISLLLPQGPTEAAPSVTVLEDGAALRAVTVETDAAGTVALLFNATGVVDGPGDLLSDGLLAGTDGASWAFLSDGTTLLAGAGLEAEATCTLDALSLSWEGAALTGAVSRPSGGCALALAWGTSPEAVEVDGAATDAWSWAAGTLTLDPAPAADFRVE